MARASRWPRTLRPTRAGWIFFALTLGVGFAALNTGNNLLYLVFSLMLSFLVLSGVLSESALGGIRVRRELPLEIYAEADNPVRLVVRNAQRRVPAFAIVIEDRRVVEPRRGRDPVARAVGRVFLLRVGAGETQTCRYTLQPEQRGELQFAPVRVSTRFPFGLFVKSRLLDLQGSALVFPALRDERPAVAQLRASREGDAGSVIEGPGAGVAGVRDFRAGDSLRRVHWKSSLRRDALLVLQVEDERDAEVEVELRTRLGAHASARAEAGFEERVSLAATEVVAHLDTGLRVGLRTEAERIAMGSGRRQRTRLLSFLARVESAA